MNIAKYITCIVLLIITQHTAGFDITTRGFADKHAIGCSLRPCMSKHDFNYELFNTHLFADQKAKQRSIENTHSKTTNNFDSKATPFTQIIQMVFYQKGYALEGSPYHSKWNTRVYRATHLKTRRKVLVKIADPFIAKAKICRDYCLAMKKVHEFWQNADLLAAKNGIILRFQSSLKRVLSIRRLC